MKKYLTIEKAIQGNGLKISVFNGNYFQVFFTTGDMLDMTKYPIAFDLSDLFKPVRKDKKLKGRNYQKLN